MDSLAFVEANKAWLGRYIRDLGVMLRSPKRFLEIVAAEPDHETAKRLFLYAVIYAALELAFLSIASVYASPITASTIFEVSVLEALYSTLLAPVFYAAGLAAGAQRPAKLAISYCLSFRFAVWIVPIFLYGLFLTTEDYGVAFARGLSVYAALSLYLLTFPVAISLRKRWPYLVGACFSTIALFAALVIGLGWLIPDTGDEGTLAKVSLLYDPIGSQVSQVLLTPRTIATPSGLVAFAAAFDAWYFNRGGPSASVSTRERFIRELQTWRYTRTQAANELDRQRKRLESTARDTVFSTTATAINVRLDEITAAQDFVAAVDEFVAQPTSGGADAVERANLNRLDATIKTLTEIEKTLGPRAKLMRMGLIM